MVVAALLGVLRSGSPGVAIGQLTEPLRDAGGEVVAPAGSRLIGAPAGDPSFGANRLGVTWTTLELPDGRSAPLDGDPALDISGAAGLPAHVRRRWGALAAASLVSALLGAGRDAGRSELERSLRRGLGEVGSEAGERLVGSTLEAGQTLTVPAGTAVRLVLRRPLVLPSER